MKKNELLTALKAVMVGVEKSNNTFGMDSLIFDNQWIRSFKDSISVSYPLDSNISIAVRGEELFKVLSKMDGEEIDLILQSEGKEPPKLMLSNKSTHLKMNSLQPEQHKQILERVQSLQTDNLEWYFLPKSFMEGLGLCIFSAGTDSALDVLAGVHFSGGVIVATDNYRISTYQMDEEVTNPFTIPTEAAQGFIKTNAEFTAISISPAWVHLTNKEGAIFSARLLSGEYPLAKITGVFDMMKFEDSETSFILPDGIDKALDRAEILAGSGLAELSKLTQVSIYNSGGNLVIQATRDVGEIIDTIPWEKSPMPEGTILRMSPDFLKKVKGITKEFKLSPTKKSILFTGEKFKHIMIARVE
jgi:hypothetical protein